MGFAAVERFGYNLIEGGCRHLVKDQMDITGARWGVGQTEAILKLRALKISGDLTSSMEIGDRISQLVFERLQAFRTDHSNCRTNASLVGRW
jgi:hypothetical protein